MNTTVFRDDFQGVGHPIENGLHFVDAWVSPLSQEIFEDEIMCVRYPATTIG